MRKFGIIVAGGSGQRMGSKIPKQFLLLHSKPLLYYTLKTFLDAYNDFELVLVVPQIFFNESENIASQLNASDRIKLVAGGRTRYHSVQNGLRAVIGPSIVFVHDAVRCLVTVDLIRRCYEQALEKGSAIPAVAATDSIRIEVNGTHKVEDRNNVRIIQTPQTFQSGILLQAFEREYSEQFTDEATVVEANGTPVFLVEGEYQNLKITRPVDLLIAEKVMEGSALL